MGQPVERIFTDNPGAVPATFALPASLDLVLSSVVARWNGAAAAGAFLPCLSVYTQDDRLVGRFHPSTELAVGDTGVVTYAPFLRREQRSRQGEINGAGLWQTVANPATIPDGFINPVALIWDTVVFNSGSYFSVANPSRLTAPSDGIYAMRGQIGYNVTVVISVSLEIVINGTFGPAPHWKAETQFSEAGQYHAVPNIAAFAPLRAGDFLELYALQKSGAARAIDPTASWFELIRLGDAPIGTLYGL